MSISVENFVKIIFGFILLTSVKIGTLTAGEETGDYKNVSQDIKEELEKLPPEPETPSQYNEEGKKNNNSDLQAPDIDDIEVPEDKKVILDIYTVKEGDTLVDLARREYDDKSFWKMIYNYNDYIRDSHWIFPGDKLILPRVVSKLPKVPEVEEEPDKQKKEKEDKREYETFLAPLDFKFDATVIGFEKSKALQAQGDYVFIDLGAKAGLEQGDQLHLYGNGRQIYHPKTGKLHGRVMKRIGTVRVTEDIEEETSTARIVYSALPVEVNQKLLLAE